MSDGFRLSNEGVADLATDLFTAEEAVIDADHPGFVSLLPLLEAARVDQVDMTELVIYHHTLSARLREARDALGQARVHPSLQERATPVLDRASGRLGALQEVLDLLGDYLGTADPAYVDRALELLRPTLDGLRGFLEQE